MQGKTCKNVESLLQLRKCRKKTIGIYFILMMIETSEL